MKFQLLALPAIFAALAIATPVAVEATENKHLAARTSSSSKTVEVAEDLELALELVLTEVTAIPDEVLLKGDEATNTWLVEQGFREPDAELDDDNDDDALSTRHVTSLSIFERDEIDARGIIQVAKCVAAISKVIISTAIPAAKLLRIKRYLKLLGGVKKTVKLLVRAKTKKQRLKLGGRVLVNLANELFGFQSIKKNCSKL